MSKNSDYAKRIKQNIVIVRLAVYILLPLTVIFLFINPNLSALFVIATIVLVFDWNSSVKKLNKLANEDEDNSEDNFAHVVELLNEVSKIDLQDYSDGGKHESYNSSTSSHNSNQEQLTIAAKPVNTTQPQKGYNRTWSSKYAYIYDNVEIYIKDAPDFSKIKINDRVELEPEPDNEYDPKAIKLICSQQPIGYLYKGTLQDMVNDYFRKSLEVSAEIDALHWNSQKIWIRICFAHKGHHDIKVYRLTGNKNEDMQDDIAYCDAGESVEFEFDDEKEKYVVSCGPYDIGYLPKSAENHFGEDLEDAEAVIDSIEIDDNDKYVVTIAIKG